MKTAMITGANGGLGRALWKRFSKAGYGLILHCRFEQGVVFPGDCCVVEGDLRKKRTIDRLSAMAENIGLDVLINNAGAYLSKPITDMVEEEILGVIESNLITPILLTWATWPALVNKSGLVVNISSIATNNPGYGESVYAASKAGLSGFSKALQFDASRDGVKVVNVLLGTMDTGFKPCLERGLLMDPLEVADSIYGLCEQDHRSLSTTEINLVRRLH